MKYLLMVLIVLVLMGAQGGCTDGTAKQVWYPTDPLPDGTPCWVKVHQTDMTGTPMSLFMWCEGWKRVD